MNSAAARSLQRRAARALAAPGAVGSPCVSVCHMGADGLCQGCLRQLDEIAAWAALDDDGRRGVWARIAERARGQQEDA